MTRLFVVAGTALLCIAGAAQGQQSRTAGYHNAARLAGAFDSLARARPQLVAVSVLATSPGNRPVQLVRLGAGANVAERPALLIVANAAGAHVAGSEIALRAAR